MWVEDWAPSAACRRADPDDLFVGGAAQHLAKRVCAGCPVRAECLAEALDHHLEWGVWGGLTERERRALLLRCTRVTSWREVIEATMGSSPADRDRTAERRACAVGASHPGG